MELKFKKKTTLNELSEQHPEIKEQVAEVVEQAIAEQRAWMFAANKDRELDSMGMGGDPHYGVYENLRNPISKDAVDNSYIFGWKKEDLKEIVKYTPLREKEHLHRLFEVTAGSEATFGGITQTQMGVPLKKRQTEAELRLMQLIVNSRYNVDPYMRNIVDNLTRYIIGNGFKFVGENSDILDVIEKFAKDVDLAQILKDYLKTSLKDGEVALNIKSAVSKRNKQVSWSVAKVFSEEIREIEHAVADGGKKLAYHKDVTVQGQNSIIPDDRWIADIEYWQQFNTRDALAVDFGLRSEYHAKLKKEEVLLWFQHGDRRDVRGRIPVESVLRDLRLLEDFRINRAILNYERSKVLYLKKLKMGMQNKNSTTEIKKSSSPKGGVQLTLGPNEEYEMMTATLNAADAAEDGLLFLYAISTGTSIPIYILGMRADVQNYSAIKNTDSPFIQMILDYAADFSYVIKKLIKYVLIKNVEAGILPKTVKIKRVAKEKEKNLMAFAKKGFNLLAEAQKTGEFDIKVIEALQADIEGTLEEVDIDTINYPIDLVIADAVKPNPLELAKVAFIERKLGMVSSQTLSERRGYNWILELTRQLEEMSLGIWTAGNDTGQKDSSQSMTGVDAGNDVDDGSGTAAQNSK